MKKITAFLILSFLLSVSLYSQLVQCEVNVNYTQKSTGTIADITVTVMKGNPVFTYYLTTNHPVKGKVLLKSEPTKKKSYVFKGVKPGIYFVKVEDNRGLPAGESVVIEETGQSSN